MLAAGVAAGSGSRSGFGVPIATLFMDAPPLSIDDLLARAVEAGASDLHLVPGASPAIRVHGDVLWLEGTETLQGDATRTLLYRILSTDQQKQLEVLRQLDFSHGVPGLGRFRVNVHFQRGTLAAAFRHVPAELRTLEELGLPDSLRDLAMKPRGLVLVTGPTGSGKSTTLASMVDEVNRAKPYHILTIEDPIEFVHRHKRCVVTQREIRTGRAHVLRGAPRGAAPGPGRGPPRRDARPRDDRHRADRRGDGPPGPRHAAYAERPLDDRPRHRRLRAGAAGAGSRAACEHPPGHRHPDASAEKFPVLDAIIVLQSSSLICSASRSASCRLMWPNSWSALMSSSSSPRRPSDLGALGGEFGGPQNPTAGAE